MKRFKYIQLKALLLLTVFSLQTVIGFACSLGIDMAYNSGHHDKQEALEPVVHIHKDGTKHLHFEKKKGHGHENGNRHGDKEQQKKGPEKDNCCSDPVNKLHQADKSIPSGLNIIHPLLASVFIAVFYSSDLYQPADFIKDIKQFVRSYHPPIADIRIAIQSFQI